MENKTVEITEESNGNMLPIIKLLLRKSVLIILVTILCALCGLGYGIMKTKPSYTASRSVVFRTEMNDGGSNTNVQTNQVSLAKLYLPSVSQIVRSSAMMTLANDNIIQTFNELSEVMDDLTVELGRTPNAKEIAERISQIRTVAEKKEVVFPVWRVEDLLELLAEGKKSTLTSGSAISSGGVGMNYKATSLIFTLSK